MRWQQSMPLWIPFAIAVVASSGLIALSVSGLARYREAQDAALQLEQLYGNTTSLFAAMTEATNAQRGYVVTEDPAYYAGYLEALDRMVGPRAAVVAHGNHTATERELVDTLEVRLEERLAALAANVGLVRDGRREEAVAQIESLRGIGQAEEIRKLLDEIVRSNAAETAEARAQADTRARQAEAGIIGLGALTAMLLISIFRTLRRRNVEETLRRSNEAKDDFLGMVSHELRSPLTVILGNARLLQRQGALLTSEEREESAVAIEAEGKRLQQVVENMLTLSRAGRGEAAEAEPVLLRQAVQEAVQVFGYRYRGDVQVRIAPDLPVVLAVPAYVQQVLENLLSNAAKYGGTAPIEITAEADGPMVRVSVRDHGRGVPPGMRERIFDPYVRLDATSRRAEGLGLGLPVSRILVEAQGGDLRVEEAEGGGSVFSFTLPVAEGA